MMDPYDRVVKHHLGFYQLKEIPSDEELGKYYKEKYYQQSHGTYEKSYSPEELALIGNRLNRKQFLVNIHLKSSELSFMDIGCGEGWALKHFHEHGWNVTGLDYSSAGIEQINPEMIGYLKQGDLYELIQKESDEYSFILMDNVLEHVSDPDKILGYIHQNLLTDGLIMIEVPNDFSTLQLNMLNEGFLEKPSWIFEPDHISYFSLDSLKNLMDSQSFEFVDAFTDFPIDLFLTNPNTNYYQKKEVGKSVHQSRLFIENLMDEISTEKTINMYRELINLGLGRNIIALFRKR